MNPTVALQITEKAACRLAAQYPICDWGFMQRNITNFMSHLCVILFENYVQISIKTKWENATFILHILPRKVLWHHCARKNSWFQVDSRTPNSPPRKVATILMSSNMILKRRNQYPVRAKGPRHARALICQSLNNFFSFQ